MEARTAVALWAITRFSVGTDGELPSEEDMIGGFFTALFYMADYRVIDRVTPLTAALKYYGYTLVPTVITDNNAPDLEDNKVLEWIDGMSDEMIEMLGTTEGHLVYLCIILLMISKTLNPTGFTNWVKNRIRSFCGALGVSGYETKFTSYRNPFDILGLNGIGSRLVSSFTIRKTVFLIIASIAKSGDSNIITTAMGVILTLTGLRDEPPHYD